MKLTGPLLQEYAPYRFRHLRWVKKQDLVFTQMAEIERCSVQDCERQSAISLEMRFYCREHFISTCYDRLEECRRWLDGRLSRDATADTVGHFLAECSRHASELADEAADLTNLERDRLLHIVLWAADLSRYLRRSLRKAVSIPVRLCREELGRAWEEETETRLLSRHGASLECQHAVEMGETLLVVRTDTGRQARARVAWLQRRKEGRREIGIEFLDCEDFWELEWSTNRHVV